MNQSIDFLTKQLFRYESDLNNFFKKLKLK